MLLGLHEGNAFVAQLHLNDYLAIALAVIAYQVIVTALYLLLRWALKRWSTVKSLGVVTIKYFLISLMIGLVVLKYLIVAYDVALVLNKLLTMNLCLTMQ